MPPQGKPFPLPRPQYEFIKILGSGSYGTVQSWKIAKTNTSVAVKRIPNAFDDFLITRRTLREMKLMTHFSHQNIIGIRDVFMMDAEKPDAEKQKRNAGWGYQTPLKDLYMFTDLMDYDLDQMIRSRRADISPRHVRSFTCQILMGLKFLHSAHVIHRDLKPANIFVRRDGQVKLGDLGLARSIDLDDAGDPLFPTGEALTEYVVTRWYRAPEILILRGCYGPACDMWAVGCILFEMIVKDILFPGKGGYDQCSKILQTVGLYPDCTWLKANDGTDGKRNKMTQEAASHAKEVINKISSDILEAIPHCYNHKLVKKTVPSPPFDRIHLASPHAGKIDQSQRDLIEKMLQFNPTRRVSVDQALQHPLFAEYKRNVDECMRDSRKVVKIDMGYDMAYDKRAGDSKNIPVEYRNRLRDQLLAAVQELPQILESGAKPMEGVAQQKNVSPVASEASTGVTGMTGVTSVAQSTTSTIEGQGLAQAQYAHQQQQQPKPFLPGAVSTSTRPNKLPDTHISGFLKQPARIFRRFSSNKAGASAGQPGADGSGFLGLDRMKRGHVQGAADVVPNEEDTDVDMNGH